MSTADERPTIEGDELLTAREYGERRGITSASARSWLSRYEVDHYTTFGSRDTRLYLLSVIEEAESKARGRGFRSDLVRKAAAASRRLSRERRLRS